MHAPLRGSAQVEPLERLSLAAVSASMTPEQLSMLIAAAIAIVILGAVLAL